MPPEGQVVSVPGVKGVACSNPVLPTIDPVSKSNLLTSTGEPLPAGESDAAALSARYQQRLERQSSDAIRVPERGLGDPGPGRR